MNSIKSTQSRRLPPDERARQLLRIAETLFSEKGFHPTTMDDIARSAGVTRTILYNHYSSKDEVAAASLAASRTRIRQTIDHASAIHVPPRNRMELFIGDVSEFISRGGRLFSAMLTDRALNGSHAGQMARAIRADVEQFIYGIVIEYGYDPNERRTAIYVQSILGALERSAEMLVDREKPPAPSELAHHLTEFIMCGLLRADNGDSEAVPATARDVI